MQISKKGILAGILILYTIAVACHLATSYNVISISPLFLAALRVSCIIPTVYYAFKKKSLTTWIMVSMIIGIEVGYDFPNFGIHLKVVSQIFLRLIKTIIAPLLFSTLALGIAGHSDMKQLGRLAWKSILYFEIVTTIALIIGLVAINLTQAGTGITLPVNENPEKLTVQNQTWQDVVLHIFPENIAKAIAEGHILQIVVFSILFGIGLAMVKTGPKQTMLRALESLSEVMFKFTSIVMHTAPFAVGAAIAYTVSHIGVGILLNLFNLLATLYLALTFLLLFVFVPIALIFKVPLKKFISAISEPVSLAFATTSSEAALPIAMEALEKKMGVPRKIVAFVMPMGYSFNLDGSTLYLSLASVFVAQ
ncbi:MAG TPA: dicarboxylate/amino acid:cation symporter, partial [Cytophagaceae bacterium]